MPLKPTASHRCRPRLRASQWQARQARLADERFGSILRRADVAAGSVALGTIGVASAAPQGVTSRLGAGASSRQRYEPIAMEVADLELMEKIFRTEEISMPWAANSRKVWDLRLEYDEEGRHDQRPRGCFICPAAPRMCTEARRGEHGSALGFFLLESSSSSSESSSDSIDSSVQRVCSAVTAERRLGDVL